MCSTVAEMPIDFRRPRYFYHSRKEEEEVKKTTKKLISGSRTSSSQPTFKKLVRCVRGSCQLSQARRLCHLKGPRITVAA